MSLEGKHSGTVIAALGSEGAAPDKNELPKPIKLKFEEYTQEDLRDLIHSYISFKACPTIDEIKLDPERDAEEISAKLLSRRNAAVNKYKKAENPRLVDFVGADGAGNIPTESFSFLFKDYPELKCLEKLDAVVENLRYALLSRSTENLPPILPDRLRAVSNSLLNVKGLNFDVLEEDILKAAKNVKINGKNLSELLLNGCAKNLNREDRKKLLADTLVRLIAEPNDIAMPAKTDTGNGINMIRQSVLQAINSASSHFSPENDLQRVFRVGRERAETLLKGLTVKSNRDGHAR